MAASRSAAHDLTDRPAAGEATPEMDALLKGTPYRALHVLGAGGMGVVVAAEHRALGKEVVVKLLHPRHVGDTHLVDRLRVEAQALARLSHENLVAVHDLGRTAAGQPYYVMDRLRGRTLREELESRGALPIAEALSLARQALAGLSVAHEAGIVHRDVKLDNLFVCDAPDPRGRRALKVLDFGVTKILEGRGEQARSTAPAPTALPTLEGVALGTPRYFSPEQGSGAPVDARSDVYAAGIVLYTLVAGRGPFDHLRDLLDVVKAHVLEVPLPPSRHAPRPVPPPLDAAILRAMAKRPEDRFASAAAFSEALAAVERDLPASDPLATMPLPPPEGARRAWLTTLPLPSDQESCPTLLAPQPRWPTPRFGPPPLLAPDAIPGAHSAAGISSQDEPAWAAVSWAMVVFSALLFGTVAAVVVGWMMTR